MMLCQSESVRLDPERLELLYRQLGEAAAEDVVCRAAEELGHRLSHCERHWRDRRWHELRKSARSLVAIADQIGMPKLSRVAADVTAALDREDPVAVAATLARMLRVGERSLMAVWDLPDPSL